LERAFSLINQAQTHTEAILKAEWQRVKQEVAYPDVLMSNIPNPQDSSHSTESDTSWPSR
jgi:hypothetical protein